MTSKDRRKAPRVALKMPVRVKGHDADGRAWSALTQCADASVGGASFVVENGVRRGQVLHVTLPLPEKLRQRDFRSPSYEVYALVRGVEPAARGSLVRVMFLLRRPAGYEKNPGAVFLMPGERVADDAAAPKTEADRLRAAFKAPAGPPAAAAPTAAAGREERRRARRLDVVVNVRVRRTEGAPAVPTILENLSRTGARLLTTDPVAAGETVWLDEIGGDFKTRAEVRNAYLGADRILRLNLRFLDSEAPLRLLG